MRKLMLLCLGLAACAAEVPQPQPDDAVGVSENALLTADGCRLPRPPVRGCKVECKPCMIPECDDGKWTYERIEWDGCNPDPLPGPACCSANSDGFCPAECHCCE